jgi:hypothetical protein
VSSSRADRIRPSRFLGALSLQPDSAIR